jgi:2-polyprenyl-6-methoxyphenol hydroxylase-like FAD-dependent oxidoreductase
VPLEVRATLTVGCDGRGSIVREKAGLPLRELGAPMDVLWFRLSKAARDPAETMGVFDAGHIFIMIDRGDYWQCAFVIPKGGIDDVKRRGIEVLRAEVARVEPALADRVGEIADWSQVHLLTVSVNRLDHWHRPGLLCIGDAAHAMSPVGGVGVNLAVQDAVAAANILADPLFHLQNVDPLLPEVQNRREWPTRITQRIQVVVQNNLIRGVLESREPLKPPLPIRLLARCPYLQRIPARLVGVGVRPEHIRTVERRLSARP